MQHTTTTTTDGDAQDSAALPAQLRHDPISHYHWLDLGGYAGDAAHQLLKAAGWRWSRYREQYYTNRRWAQPPAGIPYEDAGTCDYSAERADRLNERADKHQAASNAAYARSDRAVAGIPLGQPILVGHYSEGRHRAAIRRAHAAMDQCVTEDKIARDLAERAKSSARHQAAKTNVGKLDRRRTRLEADLRKLEREERQWSASHHDEWERRVAALRAECAALTQQIEDAGGLAIERAQRSDDPAQVVEVGDLIKIHGFSGVVVKLNPKTIKIAVGTQGRHWPLVLERSHFQALIAKKAQLDAARAEQLAAAAARNEG